MIPILYTSAETAFDTNGIGLLGETVDCTVIRELNGQDELDLQYPVDGLHFSSIDFNCIILAKPDPVTDPQPYRVYGKSNPTKAGIVTFYARHVAYDTKGITVSPFVAYSCADACQNLKTNATTECPFDFWTDKDTSAEMVVKAPTSIWTLLGLSDGSVLKTFGGEREFDRWKITVRDRVGTNRGVSIRYGKNLETLEQDANCANCYTGVHPFWSGTDGTLVELPEKVLHAEGDYGYTRIMPLDLSNVWQEAPTEEQIREYSVQYMVDNEIGKPEVSLTVSFIPLEKTEEYKDTAILEQVLLGDTVNTVFPKLKLDVLARAVATRYKPIPEKYENVTVGSVRSSFSDTVARQNQELEKKPTMTVMNNIISKLADSLTGVKGGSIRFLDTDGDNMPDELYIADNPDPNFAVKVWRFNYEGWASSRSGYAGPFTMGATLADGLLAEFVTAAHLIAGTIQSKDPDAFFLDLDNGILRIKALDKLSEDFAALKVDSDAISISVQKLLSDGVTSITTTTGYTFNADGLWISKLGQEIVNRLDHTGMYVSRGDKIMLQANADGVEMENAKIRTRLNLGEHTQEEEFMDADNDVYCGRFWI